MVNDIVLRSQAQAKYDPDNIGHFGLSLKRYCHFTSPIRRYSDLLVHRALILGMIPSAGSLPQDPGDFNEIGEHLCITERRAQAAERGAMDRYSAHYLKDRVGATFGARISGATRFGLFITVNDIGADGLIPIKSLANDYYIHDEDKHMLTGRRTGNTYRMGDRIEVVLREVTPITGGMIFELVGSSRSSGKAQPEPEKRNDRAQISRKPKKTKGKSRAARRMQRAAAGADPKKPKKNKTNKNKGRPKR